MLQRLSTSVQNPCTVSNQYYTDFTGNPVRGVGLRASFSGNTVGQSGSLAIDKAVFMTIRQSSTCNALLSRLNEADFTLLQPHLMRMALPRLLELYAASDEIEHVYFPEDGVVSIVAVEANGHQVEVGIVGREGMAGTPALLGNARSPHRVCIQVKGVSGLKLQVSRLRQAMEESPKLRGLLLRYVQTVMVQNASWTTAVASYRVGQRLARCLLMCNDRLRDQDVDLTHDVIGMMLGARRAGVTIALQLLQSQNLIVMKRGSITVRDRTGLERLAGGSYGFAEAEYQRVMGFSLKALNNSGSASVKQLTDVTVA